MSTPEARLVIVSGNGGREVRQALERFRRSFARRPYGHDAEQDPALARGSRDAFTRG
jgi:hypothetical protein